MSQVNQLAYVIVTFPVICQLLKIMGFFFVGFKLVCKNWVTQRCFIIILWSRWVNGVKQLPNSVHTFTVAQAEV